MHRHTFSSFFSLFSLLFACGEVKNEDTADTTNDTVVTDTADTTDTSDSIDTVDTTDTTDTTDTSDTTDTTPPLIVAEGTWRVGTPTVLEDVCSLQTYQDVKGFVPSEISITNSSAESFYLDDTVLCGIEDGEFSCETQEMDQSVMTFTFHITSTMLGSIEDSTHMDLHFDVVVESCDGFGCGLLESVLAFPCVVTLESTASL